MLLALEACSLSQIFPELLCALIEDVGAVGGNVCEGWALSTLGPLYGACGERAYSGAGGDGSEGVRPLYKTREHGGGGESAGMWCRVVLWGE